MSMGKDVVRQHAATVQQALEAMKEKIEAALPAHLTPDRLLRVALTACNNQPRLYECDRTSLYAAVMTCAQLGLEPDGVLGQAYLVPFKKRVQFIPGYKGYITLARNSGYVASIQAHEVCENDHFEYRYGIHENLDHVPTEGDRGEITHFYAYAMFKDGGYCFEVLTKAEVDKVRDNSEGYKAFKSGAIRANPWDSHYVQMGRKTAIRRLANYLPLAVQRAAAMDSAYDQGKGSTTDDFGDVVIDSSAEDVTDQQQQDQTGAKGATAALDALNGGEDSSTDDQKGAASPKTKTTKKKTAKKSKKKAKKKPAEPDPAADDDELTAGKLTAAIIRAETVEAVDEVLDLARGLKSADDADTVRRAADSRKKQLQGGGNGGSGLFGDES